VYTISIALTSSPCYYQYGLHIVKVMSRPTNEDKNLAAFGKKMSSLRRKQGLTQEQLSERTGLAVDSIGAIEQGRRWARLTTLHILAKGLGVKLESLFKDL
jgi:DNA-binding XRE family transcriptional regulator